MTKQNILFLLHLPPPIHGSSMMGQFIHQSKRINSSFKSRYINLLASQSIADTGKVSVQKLWRFVRLKIKLVKELINDKPDLCYFALTTTGAAFFRDVILVAILKFFHVKKIYHLHNKGVKEKQQNAIYNWAYRFVFKKSKVVLLSEYLYRDVETFVPQENVAICPNGIPGPSVPPNSERGNNRPVEILFLSNLIKTKGVFDLLKACKQIHQKSMDFRCIFVGGEGDINRKEFDNKVLEYGLQNVVKYVGRKTGNKKNKLLAQADIFAFPTCNDCFPLVLLEAMQFKLPIVTTNEGGIRSIIEDNKTGFIIPQDDSESLANKLEILIKNESLRNRLGLAGHEKYRKEFTLEKFEMNVATILQNATLT